MGTQARTKASGAAVAAMAVAAITLLVYPLREVAPVVGLGVLYLLAVLLVSSLWGAWLGLATALVSALAFNFFHLPPTGRFTIASEENWVALVVFFVVAIVSSQLAERARKRADEAEQRRREADLAAEMARLLLGSTELDESLRVVGQRIARTFELPSVSIQRGWVAAEARTRALPLLVAGSRTGTLLIPKNTPAGVVEALEDRVVPALEALVGAALERSELEAQVVETKALRRSNVVKTALLRSVSHDLRSPLTAITAAAGALGSDGLNEEEREELTAVVVEESQRLAGLVDDLLDFSRLQAGAADPEVDWVSIDDSVRSAADSLPAPPGGFDVDIEPGVPLVKADAAQIERALVNVLDNAARYAGAEPVTVRATSAGRFVTLRVSDSGPGVSRNELERIFEPFHRSGERSGGSGLGLAIARGFVEASGGRLRAESLPGQGTTVILQLPLPDAEPAAKAIPAEDSEA